MARKTISVHVVGALGTEEALASGTVKPGHLIETIDGRVRRHATAGGNAEKAIAIEASSEDGGTVNVEYADGELVYYRIFQSGEHGLVRIANGEAVEEDDFLESNGDGTFRIVDPDPSVQAVKVASILARSLEDCDMSGSNAADVPGGFCLVRFL